MSDIPVYDDPKDVPHFSRSTPHDHDIREIGYRLPNGQEEFRYLTYAAEADLRTAEGRGKAQDAFRNAVEGAGVSADGLKLTFITRIRSIRYGKVEELVED